MQQSVSLRPPGTSFRNAVRATRSTALLPWIGWIVLLGALAYYWVQLNASHHAQLRQAEAQVQKGAAQTARALAQQTDTMFRKVDYITLQLGEVWLEQGDVELRKAISVAQQALPAGAVVQVAVANGRGDVVFSSLTSSPKVAQARHVSIADREHFRVHLQDPEGAPRLFISQPLLGRVSQQWTVQFSRPLRKNQAIAGVIVLSVSVDHLSDALHAIYPDPADVAWLVRDDGAYLARSSGLASVLGKSVPSTREFLTTPRLQYGMYGFVSPVDGVERYHAWHRAANYPVVVGIGLSKANALAAVRGALQDSHAQNAVGSVLLLLAAAWITWLWVLRGRQAATLANASERLEMALRGGDLGTWDWNCETDRNHVNARWAEMFGYRGETLLLDLSAWRNRIHPEDWPRVFLAFGDLQAGRTEQYEAEYRMQHSNGEWVWVLDRGRIVERHDNGTARRMVGTVLDISARKRAEMAEKLSREHLSKLVSEVPGTVYQYLLRADGSSCFPYASPGIQSIYGVSPDEVTVSAEKVYAHLHPADLARVRASILESAQKLANWRCEYRVLHAGGAVRWVLGHAKPERTVEGDTLWYGYIQDITAEHEAAEVLKLSEEHLRLALQAVRDGLWSWDFSTSTLEWDARIHEMLGYADMAPTLTEHDWRKLLHPSERESVLNEWNKIPDHPDQLIKAEFRLRTVNGGWLWVEVRGRIVEWGVNGLPSRAIGTMTDVSARVAETQLRRALLDQSAAAIGLVSKERKFVYANARAKALFVLPGQDIVGYDVRSVHLSEDRYVSMEKFNQILRSEGQVRFEFPMRDAQGHARWFDMQGMLRDPDDPDSDAVWTWLDITEKHLSENALAMERLRLTTLLERFPGGVLMEDAAEVVAMANQSLCDLLDLAETPATLQGLSHASLCERLGQLRASWLHVPTQSVDGEKRRDIEISTPNGRNLEINWVPIVRQGEQLGRVWLLHDISERKQRERALATLASTDMLTGLPNRRSFMESLDAGIANFRAHPASGGALLMADIDHFKRVNDTYGHPVGDTVLRHVAQTIRNCLRQEDAAGRLGGEEFTVLLKGISAADALAQAHRIRETLAGLAAVTSAGEIKVTISIGLVMLNGDDADLSLSHADEALYTAKNTGRNRVCVWQA